MRKLTLPVLLVTAFGALLNLGAARAAEEAVKIGVLTDMIGVTASYDGPAEVDAVHMAVDDFGGKVLGKPITVVSADHQNKPDVGLALAREWLDSAGVTMIMGLPNSSIALGVQQLGAERKVIIINTDATTSDLTRKACSPYGVSWVYDSYAMAQGVAAEALRQGGKSWFFITFDYAGGYALENDATARIVANGGRVLGSVRFPPNAPDFSSFLLQAKGSGAKVVGLAFGGDDMKNAIKQAHEFGIIEGGQILAPLQLFAADIRAVGLNVAQGIKLVEAFYWDQDDQTRAWSKRFYERNKTMPTMLQAGAYGAVMHYLKAVQATGTVNSDAVMKKMRETPINDFMTHDATIREDGRVMRDMYLYQVKTPAESKGGDWDVYKLIGTIPAKDAWRPLSEGGCPLVK
jgi:branched-chain amino acid transport system substrate-binding protein